MAALAVAGVAAALPAGPASAHPLGNYTVNRAVAVTVGADRISVTYVVDMAEIPAFGAIGEIDSDADGVVSSAEGAPFAEATCERMRGALSVSVNGISLEPAARAVPELSFPAGAGGLRTLRLSCHLQAAMPAGLASGALTVSDATDDGHVGWREVTIASADGVGLTDSDVPAISPSARLTAYPADRLESPPDVRRGAASFVLGEVPHDDVPATAAVVQPPTADDPLARLIAGELTPPLVALALLLAAGLGAAHALSPGHGKTLVAAYLVGSRGTIRQAMALGLAVALTHTAGVLVLGGLVLLAGELLLPEAAIGWLTLLSGGMMAALGGSLLRQALHRRGTVGHDHSHRHDDAAAHAHGRGALHQHPDHAAPPVTVRSVALLGMVGGLVPSASALIVLLAAVTTGRWAFGLALITSFGAGMAVVLGGLAVATTVARGWLSARVAARGGGLRRALVLLPIGSGMLVLGIGLAIMLGAAVSLG